MRTPCATPRGNHCAGAIPWLHWPPFARRSNYTRLRKTVGLQMPFHNPALLLLGQLVKHFAQVLTQIAVQNLSAAFGDKNNVVLALPFRVA